MPPRFIPILGSLLTIPASLLTIPGSLLTILTQRCNESHCNSHLFQAYKSFQVIRSIRVFTNHNFLFFNGITCAIPAMSAILTTWVRFPSSHRSIRIIPSSPTSLAGTGVLEFPPVQPYVSSPYLFGH